MSIRLLFAASCTAFIALTAPCMAVITISGNNLGGAGLLLVDKDGGSLPTGSAIRVGYFNDPVTNAAILEGTSFSDINSLFTPLGEGLSNLGTVTSGALGIGATAGRFNVAVSNIVQNAAPPNNLPVGTPLYFWVFNNVTPSAASQWAIFTNNDANAGGSPWVAPFDDPNLGGSATFAVRNDRVDDLDDVVRGTVAGNQLFLSPIPEPSLAALCLMAVPFLSRRRRS